MIIQASQFSDEQIVHHAERDDQRSRAIGRAHGSAEATFDRWRTRFGGMTQSEVQRLRELEKEHSRLKRLLAERDVEDRPSSKRQLALTVETKGMVGSNPLTRIDLLRSEMYSGHRNLALAQLA